MDVYISRKIRENKNFGFGFIRFERYEEASAAIDAFNGVDVMGKKIYVSMAKTTEMARHSLSQMVVTVDVWCAPVALQKIFFVKARL